MKKILSTMLCAIFVLTLAFTPMKKAESAASIASCVTYGNVSCYNVNTIAIFIFGLGMAWSGGEVIYVGLKKYFEMDEDERDSEDLFAPLINGVIRMALGGVLLDENTYSSIDLKEVSNDQKSFYGLTEGELNAFNENREELNLIINEFAPRAVSAKNESEFNQIKGEFKSQCNQFIDVLTCQAFEKISQKSVNL